MLKHGNLFQALREGTGIQVNKEFQDLQDPEDLREKKDATVNLAVQGHRAPPDLQAKLWAMMQRHWQPF